MRLFFYFISLIFFLFDCHRAFAQPSLEWAGVSSRYTGYNSVPCLLAKDGSLYQANLESIPPGWNTGIRIRKLSSTGDTLWSDLVFDNTIAFTHVHLAIDTANNLLLFGGDNISSMLVSYDNDGHSLWSKYLIENHERSIFITPSLSIFTLSDSSDIAGSSFPLIHKYKMDGTLIFSHTDTVSPNVRFFSKKMLYDGNGAFYILYERQDSLTILNRRVCVSKYDTSGVFLWRYQQNGYDCSAVCMDYDEINHALLIGGNGTTTSSSIRTIRLKSDGNEDWSMEFDQPNSQGSINLSVSKKGEAYHLINNVYTSSYSLIKYDSVGTQNFVVDIDSSAYTQGYGDLVVGKDDFTYLSIPMRRIESPSNCYISVRKYYSSGICAWNTNYGDSISLRYTPQIVLTDALGSIYISGISAQLYPTLLKYSQLDGTPLPLGKKNEEVHVYPNPSSGVVNIEVSEQVMPHGKCLIQIFDVSGKLMREEILKEKSSQLNLRKLAKGMYLYKIANSAGEEIKAGKIILE